MNENSEIEIPLLIRKPVLLYALLVLLPFVGFVMGATYEYWINRSLKSNPLIGVNSEKLRPTPFVNIEILGSVTYELKGNCPWYGKLAVEKLYEEYEVKDCDTFEKIA